ncbi:MAG: hypothetical protein P9L99_01880 [Candidatus Lernaella stagnicola]|nr:hypothetical protein [Candidatus Lernaella stagnicola]
MKISAVRIFGLILLLCLATGIACGSDDDGSGDSDDPVDDDDNDDNDDDDDDNNDDNDDNNDDTDFPFIAPVEPLNWRRYGCPAEKRPGITVVTGNYNIHTGREGTPAQVGEDLAAWGPFDVFSLQECPPEYAEPIAEALGMYYFYSDEQSLMSATPLINPEKIDYLDSGRGRFLHADVVIEGVTFSVYGVHVSWNEVGDSQNREIVDDYLAVDPVDRVLLMGDWNEELGSTQARILDEVVADGWASFGVCPSCRTTWPAMMFYGAEGQQLIDNTYFNKSSGGCTVDGEIIHMSPNRSDHKPQTTTIFFPETPGYTPPILLEAVYGFGENAVGLLFDKPIADAQVELLLNGSSVELTSQGPINEGSLYLLEAAETLPGGNEYTARIVFAEGVDGARTDQTFDFTFPYYENLLENPGAENGESGWTWKGMQPTAEINHVIPLAGTHFFSGSGPGPRDYARQDVPLDAYAEIIDAGYGQLVFSGASATGYRVEEGGTSNILLPHDEAEAVVEILDGQGRLLKHISGGRFDTLYWQAWRVMGELPPLARTARVVLRACAAEMPLTFNSASFDALFLSVMTLENPHTLIGENLVANPLFENGREHWTMSKGIILAKDHWIPIRSNIDVNSATGEYWVAALLLNTGPYTISQDIPLADFEDMIQQDLLSLNWGAYLRTWNPRSEMTMRVTFYDDNTQVSGADEFGPINVPEWFRYEKITAVPLNSTMVRLEWIATAGVPIIGVGAFFDAPFAYPVLSQ